MTNKIKVGDDVFVVGVSVGLGGLNYNGSETVKVIKVGSKKFEIESDAGIVRKCAFDLTSKSFRLGATENSQWHDTLFVYAKESDFEDEKRFSHIFNRDAMDFATIEQKKEMLALYDSFKQ